MVRIVVLGPKTSLLIHARLDKAQDIYEDSGCSSVGRWGEYSSLIDAAVDIDLAQCLASMTRTDLAVEMRGEHY